MPTDTIKFAVVLSLVVVLLSTVRLIVALIENLGITARLKVKVSEEQAARQALTDSEMLSQAITDSVLDGLYVVGPDGLMKFVNPAALRFDSPWVSWRLWRFVLGLDRLVVAVSVEALVCRF